MKVIKLKHLLNSKEVLSELCVEQDTNPDVLYGEFIALLMKEKLDDDFILKLSAYAILRFGESSDCVKDFKKLSTGNEDIIYIVSKIKRLSSTLLKDIKVSSEGTVAGSPAYSFLVSYIINMLIYYVEVQLKNTKFNFNGVKTKISEIPEIREIFRDNYESAAMLSSVLSDAPIEDILRTRKQNVFDFINNIKFANSIEYSMKLELPAMYNLLEKLMPSESKYYVGKSNTVDVLGHLIVSDYKDGIHTIELSKKFYNLLRYRKYLIPHQGISISPSQIEMDIDIYERQLDGDNYLIIFTKVRGNSDLMLHTVINLTKEYIFNDCGCIYDILNFLYYFYELAPYAEELYGKDFIDEGIIYHSYRATSLAYEPIENVRGTSKDVYSDYEVCVPYYWRYKNKPKSVISSTKFRQDVKSGKVIYLSAFKRALPKGSKPSDEALGLAKVYNLVLLENETIVSPHTRDYSKSSSLHQSNLFGDSDNK